MSFGAVGIERAMYYDSMARKSDQELREVISKYKGASFFKKIFYMRSAATAETILQRREEGIEKILENN